MCDKGMTLLSSFAREGFGNTAIVGIILICHAPNEFAAIILSLHSSPVGCIILQSVFYGECSPALPIYLKEETT